MEHPQRPSMQIPFHGVVKTGLLMNTIKRAGFSVEEFLEAL